MPFTSLWRFLHILVQSCCNYFATCVTVVSEAEATAVCIEAVKFAEDKIELKYRYSATHPIISVVEIDFLYYLNLSLAPFGARATKQSNYGAVPVRQAHYW